MVHGIATLATAAAAAAGAAAPTITAATISATGTAALDHKSSELSLTIEKSQHLSWLLLGRVCTSFGSLASYTSHHVHKTGVMCHSYSFPSPPPTKQQQGPACGAARGDHWPDTMHSGAGHIQ